MCGAITYEVAGDMLWAAHCHCEDCQRAAGADYVSWFGVRREAVTWRGRRGLGDVVDAPGKHASSPLVGFRPIEIQAVRLIVSRQFERSEIQSLPF